jgi:hypothetical protein
MTGQAGRQALLVLAYLRKRFSQSAGIGGCLVFREAVDLAECLMATGQPTDRSRLTAMPNGLCQAA